MRRRPEQFIGESGVEPETLDLGPDSNWPRSRRGLEYENIAEKTPNPEAREDAATVDGFSDQEKDI